MHPVSVIIPVWNAVEYTKKCISLLYACKSSIDELIIIDNGSRDETSTYLAKLMKSESHGLKESESCWLKVHTFPENTGFVNAVNFGVNLAKPENDLLIMNNDVEIIDPKTIKTLQEYAHSLPNCAAVHPRQIGPDGIFRIGPCFTLPVSKYGHGFGMEPDVRQFSDIVISDILMFACIYIVYTSWKKVGPLDANFFSYAEDSDWCIRARQAGLNLYYLGNLSVIHHVNATSTMNAIDPKTTWQDESVRYFAEKHKEYFDTRYVGEVMIQGTCGGGTGYGEMTMQIMRHLEMNIDTPVKVHYGHLYSLNMHEGLSNKPDIDDIRTRWPRSRIPMLICGQGDVMYKNSGSPRLGLSMMDCDRWPDEWVYQINEGLDTLITPTQRNADDGVKSGITIPIKVIPLGVDPNYYHPGIKPFTEFRFIKYRTEINFLSMFQWGERKMPILLMKAWLAAFHNDPDITLFIKTDLADSRMSIQGDVAKARLAYPKSKAGLFVFTYPEWQGSRLENFWMSPLIRSHDAFVQTSGGEGFNLVPCESMACGLPVGITGEFGYFPENREKFQSVTYWDYDWQEIRKEDCFCPYYWPGKNGPARWARAKFDDIVDKLKWMKENLTDLKAKALIDSKYIRENVTWTQTAAGLRELICKK